ncbi:MAG TPA: hypothetical protein VHL34_23415 [Rhizomicrobium sp.]|jgi:hypothetical protein|nr:hypothetical protein [Rhizomicrobium sp.]
MLFVVIATIGLFGFASPLSPTILRWRHISVIYDVSQSYQHERGISAEQDRAQNLDRVAHIGTSITDNDYFSFLAMDGWVRNNCDLSTLKVDELSPWDMHGIGYLERHRPVTGELTWREAFKTSFREIRSRLEWSDSTDIKGALSRAELVFEKYPARERYLLVFSDLDDTPVEKTSLGLCGHLDLRGVVVVVVNFGYMPSAAVKVRRPSPGRRMASFREILYQAGAKSVKFEDIDGPILHELGIEAR